MDYTRNPFLYAHSAPNLFRPAGGDSSLQGARPKHETIKADEFVERKKRNRTASSSTYALTGKRTRTRDLLPSL